MVFRYVLSISLLVVAIIFNNVHGTKNSIRVPFFRNSNEDPVGVKGIITQIGTQKAIDQTLGSIEKAIQEIAIPDIHLTQHVSLVGDVDIDITGITITQCVISDVKVTLLEDTNTIDVLAEGLSLAMSLNWAYKQKDWPHSSGDGTADATVDQSTIELGVSVGLTADKKPSFKTTKNSVQLNTMNVEIHGGGLAWLLNLLKSLFQNQIKEAAEQGIQQSLDDQINNQLNAAISAASFVVPIEIKPLGLTIEVDLTLPTQPKVSPASVTATCRGETYIEGQHIEPPFSPVPLPAQMETQNYANVFLTDWIANDAGFTLHKSGKLHYIITPDMVPPESPIKLNTTDLKSYIPDLYEKYPNYGVAIEISSAAPPTFNFLEGQGAQVSANVTMLFSVIKPGTTTTTKAFLIDVVAQDAVDKFAFISFNQGLGLNITGHIQDAKCDFKLIESYIGDIDVSRMNLLVTLFLNNGLIPAANDQLQAGVTIPLPPGLNVTSPNLNFHKGYATAGVDLQYQPAAWLNPRNPKHRVLLDRYNNLKRM